MNYFYSKSASGFYVTEVHGAAIPADAVAITEVQHAELLAGQSSGKQITSDANGTPVLTDPPPPSANQLILSQIAALEATVTQRRMREAALGTDGGWLKAIDAEVAALRKGLK